MLVVMVEERSMKELLSILLPLILPPNTEYQIIPHNGKSDLKKSIPKKLASWTSPDTKFVIVHDQDSNDCTQLKRELQDLCNSIKPGVLVRIACMELESWYFGDMNALAVAYGKDKIKLLSTKSKYRIPDKIVNPKAELMKLLPEHQQISGAKRIAPHMDINGNKSTSFNTFVKGIKRLYNM